MSKVVYGVIVLLVLVLLVGLTGLLLPKQRVETRQTIFQAPIERVFNTVSNPLDWAYRSDVASVKLIGHDDNQMSWEETTKDGSVIQFTSGKKVPYSFYSFDLKNEFMTGYWTAEFTAIAQNQTQFIATEYVEIRNPFIKVINYLFFDLGAFMETYQNDLRVKLAQPAS